MIGNGLLLILRGFTNEEFRRFGEFLNSDYFNRQTYVKALWDYLKDYYPEFDIGKLAKGDLFLSVYPGQKFKESRIRNLCSDLKLLAEKFLTVETFLNDSRSQETYKLETLNARRQHRLFNKEYEKIQKRNDKRGAQNEWAMNHDLKLYSLRFAYLNASGGAAEETEEIFRTINDTSLKFFLTVYFKNCHRILNKKRTFFNYGYTPRYFDTACGIINSNPEEFKNDTYLMLNYLTVMLYVNYDDTSFRALYDFSIENLRKLSAGDATDVLTALINYCRTQSLRGSKEYEFKALEIYKLLAESGIWNSNNLLRPSVYRGAVSVAGNCGEFEWAESFINRFRDLQPAEHRQSNFFLCYGRLFFDRREFGKAIESLAKVRNEDSSYKYETDALLMKIYYETGETESLFSKIDSFKHWVNNNKVIISGRYREVFKKMADCIETLAKLKLNPDDFRLNQLKCSIEEDGRLVNRLWMLEKIEELIIAKTIFPP